MACFTRRGRLKGGDEK